MATTPLASSSQSSPQPLLLPVGQGPRMHNVQGAVIFCDIDDLHEASACAATHDQQLVILDLLGKWGASRFNDHLGLIDSDAMFRRVFKVPVVPSELVNHTI